MTVYTIKAFNAKGELMREVTRSSKRAAREKYHSIIATAQRFGGFATCEPDPDLKEAILEKEPA